MAKYIAKFHNENRPSAIFEGKVGLNWKELEELAKSFFPEETFFRLSQITDESKLFKCQICGGYEYLDNYNDDFRKILSENNICFTCNHFLELLEYRLLGSINKSNHKTIVINGNHYTICPDTNNYFKGSGGREFMIRILKTEEIISCKNLWCQGKIPEWFKLVLSDNAEFLSHEKKVEICSRL